MDQAIQPIYYYCSIGSHLQKIFRNLHTVAQFGGGKDVPLISLIGGTASQLKVTCCILMFSSCVFFRCSFFVLSGRICDPPYTVLTTSIIPNPIAFFSPNPLS
jgi:hypothetical protein